MKRFRFLMILTAIVIATTAVSWSAVFVSVSFGPPLLPVYAQPPIPAPGYIWVPGYWAWSPDLDDYYWVPGTWVLPPQVGYLWTPGYWRFSEGLYYWHPGYWGATVGYYGGINYGYGYPGNGYYGGRWEGRQFYYNRAVNNVTNVTNVYNQTVVNNYQARRVSYNDGPGGVQARPTQAQLAAERARHFDPTPVQRQHEQAARNDRTQFASANQGRPAIVATPQPGALNAPQAVKATLPAANRQAPATTANNRPVPRPPQQNQQVRQPQNNRSANRSAQAQQVPQPEQNVPRPPNEHAQVNEPQRGAPAQNQPPDRTQREVPQRPQHASPPPHVNESPARPLQEKKEQPPEIHAASRSPANPTQRPPVQHQAEPPRQTAQHQEPARQEERPR